MKRNKDNKIDQWKIKKKKLDPTIRWIETKSTEQVILNSTERTEFTKFVNSKCELILKPRFWLHETGNLRKSNIQFEKSPTKKREKENKIVSSWKLFKLRQLPKIGILRANRDQWLKLKFGWCIRNLDFINNTLNSQPDWQWNETKQNKTTHLFNTLVAGPRHFPLAVRLLYTIR